MPKGGHNRKPTHLKVLQGNPGKRPLNPNEPKPRPVAPRPPSGMDTYARRAWRRLSPILERLGLLTEADGEAFTALCEAWGRYWRARGRLREMVRATSTWEDVVARTDAIRKAEVSVEKAEHSFRMLAIEFGLTPAARSRLNVNLASEQDEFEEFLSHGKGRS